MIVRNWMSQGIIPKFPNLSGVVGRWDITNYASLTLSSNKIVTVNDLTGNGNHITQATDSKRFTYNANGGSNNLPYAGTSVGKSLVASISLSQPYTLLYVIKQNTWTDLHCLFHFAASGYNGVYQKNSAFFSGLTKPTVTLASGTSFSSAFINNFTLGEWSLGGFVQNGNDAISVYNKNISQSPYLKLTGTANITQFAVGSPSLTVADFGFHEAVLYNRSLTYNEIYQILTYWAYKYRILETKKNVVTLGDSISSGYSATNIWGYAEQFSEYIGGYLDMNALSGMTSDFVKTQIDAFGKYKDKNAYILLQAGANDGTTGANLSNFEANWRYILTYLIAHGQNRNKIILVSKPPFRDALNAMDNFQLTLLPSLAVEFGVKWVDNITPMTGHPEYYNDTVHPNSAGHTLMFNNIVAVL